MNKIFYLSLISSLYLLLIIPSLEIISSSPADFSNIWKIVGVLFYVYLFSILVFLFIFRKISIPKRKIFTLFMFFILLYFISNYYILSGDYGLMDYFVFHNSDGLNVSSFMMIRDIFVALALILISFLSLHYLSHKNIKNMLVFFMLVLFISSIKFIYEIKQKNTDININKSEIKHKTKYNLKKEITFSKNGKNVLILFLDRAMGGFMPNILKDNPKLKEKLSGFVWYPNSLSIGTGTAVGLAPIYGGYKFANVENMMKAHYRWNFGNQIDSSDNMVKRYKGSVDFMPRKFYNKGYDVCLFDTNFLSKKTLSSMSNNTYKFKNISSNKNYLQTFYYPYELDRKNNNKSPFSMSKEYMIPYSIFKIISPSLRKYIYNNGTWYAGLSSVAVNYSGVIREIAYARAWRYISKINNNPNGTFNFITSNITHNVPVNKNKNNTFQGVIPEYSSRDKKKFKDKHTAYHYYLNVEAIKQSILWFEWLKKNNIYNNTKIIMVSDHGAPSTFNPMFKNQKSSNRIHYGSYHINLMVKDFNQTDNLKIDNTFMTHADVPYLALEAIDDNAKKKYGYDKSNGFRLYTHYRDRGSLVVYDNIFEDKNWVYSRK